MGSAHGPSSALCTGWSEAIIPSWAKRLMSISRRCWTCSMRCLACFASGRGLEKVKQVVDGLVTNGVDGQLHFSIVSPAEHGAEVIPVRGRTWLANREGTWFPAWHRQTVRTCTRFGCPREHVDECFETGNTEHAVIHWEAAHMAEFVFKVRGLYVTAYAKSEPVLLAEGLENVKVLRQAHVVNTGYAPLIGSFADCFKRGVGSAARSAVESV